MWSCTAVQTLLYFYSGKPNRVGFLFLTSFVFFLLNLDHDGAQIPCAIPEISASVQ